MLRFHSSKEKALLCLEIFVSIIFGLMICVWDFFFATTVGDLTSRDPDDIRSATRFIAFAFLGQACLVMAIDPCRTACFRYLCEHQLASIKSRYFQALLRQEPAWHDSQSSSAHISRFSYQIPKLKGAFDTSLSFLIFFMSKGIVSLILALASDFKLALAVLSILPIIAALFILFGRIASQTSTRQARAYERGAAVATEDLGLLRTIWTFCTQAFEQHRLVWC
jgi:ABC-type multidrug transport system fused ATPase/permease subunit